MSSGVEIILYSTDHCALCEQALDLLLSMPELAGWQLVVVDVALDDSLSERYGRRLPVLTLGGDHALGELDWPFDAAAVGALLAQLK